LDAETKQPVEDGWVQASMWITTKTVSGDVGKVISVEKPHTRTGKDGKFIIPSKELKKPPFPISFGIKVDKFEIVVATLNKSGRTELDLKELDKKRVEAIIFMEDLDKAWQKELKHIPPEKFLQEKELREFSSLQAFYNYCLTGRFSAEAPSGSEGCDDWELEYIIKKHEKFLIDYQINIEQKGYSIIFDQLASLYEKKGDIKKAIEILKKSIALMERKGLLKFPEWQKNKENIERKIKVLSKKAK
jgi:tetratricopeptide (TPR) repeat protein